MLKELVQKKRIDLKKQNNNAFPQHDLITSLLCMRDEEGQEVITEKEIVQNAMLVMVAGHDTSAVLITFLVRLLANEPAIFKAVLQGMHRSIYVWLIPPSFKVQYNSFN